jgi:hypothetical protein
VEGVVETNLFNFCDGLSQKSPAHNFAGKYGKFAIFKNPSQPKRLGTGGNQSVTICNGLKMVSIDGFSASASSEYF